MLTETQGLASQGALFFRGQGMETIRRFADKTRLIAGRIAAAGVVFRLLPFAAGLLFGGFRLGDLPGVGSFGGFILPAAGLAFLCALWCAGMTDAVLPAALGVIAGSLLSGQYVGAVSAALYAFAAIYMKDRPRLILLYRIALLLGTMLVMLPLGLLFGAWQRITPTDVFVHIGGCALTLLAAAIETRALSAADPLRRRQRVTDEQTVAAAFFAGICALALNRFRLLGICFGSVFAAFFCMAAADTKGAAAVAAAAIVSAMRVLGVSGDLLYIAVLCCCTLTASLFRQFGKWVTAAGFAVPAVLFFALIPGGGTLNMGEIVLSTAAFLAAPALGANQETPVPFAGRKEFEKQRLLSQNYRLTVLSDVLSRIGELFVPADGPADAFINSQLGGVAKSLLRMTESAGRPIGDVSRPRFTVSFGSASCPKRDSVASGDSRLVRDFDGLYLAAISDGMGSGKAAARESTQAVQLLADLVTCGFRLEEAADCVNRLLLLREEGEMYATLDALLFDPVRGKLFAAKHGAPPSYLLRRGELRALYAEALPVGILPEARTAVFDTDLRRGDVVIMMSDGAADALGKDLPESVARITPENEPVIAAKLLVELAARAGGRDDMTVIVAKTQ